MAQPQPQMPARAFSPPQHSPSPAATQPGFALPPNKRPRLSPGSPSQPESPYATSPYAASPGAPGTPSTAATSTTSPTYFNAQPNAVSNAANTYATPYTNGHSTPAISLPESRPTPPPPALPTPQIPSAPSPQYTTSTLVPGLMVNTPGAHTPGAPGTMGPPSRPPDKPQKEYEYDVTDSLAGTGIDLRAEEQYLSELYALDPQVPESRTGFGQYPAGSKTSFYGAGPANQPAQPTAAQNQNQLAAESAEKAWQESAKRLASSRSVELNSPFLIVSALHQKADKIAREYGIQLNLDLKTNQQQMGRMKLSEEFPKPRVTVGVKQGPDGAMVHTTGSFIPHDAYLVDQLALLSIATKHRIRGLVEESNRIAVTRQKSSHGEVPEEWAVAAAPLKVALPTNDNDESERTGADSAVSPRMNSLKRTADAAGMGDATSANPTKVLKTITNNLTVTVRDVGRSERDWEEARLRKRNARKDGTTEGGSAPSRAGSVAPGTPGSVAPESEKALSKKESKKAKAARDAEASSHVNQNLTSSLFVGMPRTSSLFGKKSGKKTYSWMTGGGSGASTPKRTATGGAAAGTPGTPTPTSHALTVDGRNRLGTWREDQVKGKNIQLRDWLVALESDGIEKKAMQDAYDKLEASEPK